MAKCSQSCLGLLQDMQIWKGQWGTMDELDQLQLLTGQLLRGSLENFCLKTNKTNFSVHLQTSQQLATVTVEALNKQLSFLFGICQFLPVTFLTTALWSLPADRGDVLFASSHLRTGNLPFPCSREITAPCACSPASLNSNHQFVLMSFVSTLVLHLLVEKHCIVKTNILEEFYLCLLAGGRDSCDLLGGWVGKYWLFLHVRNTTAEHFSWCVKI